VEWRVPKERDALSLAISIVANALGEEIARKSLQDKKPLTMASFQKGIEPGETLMDWAEPIGPTAIHLADATTRHAHRYLNFKHETYAAYCRVRTICFDVRIVVAGIR
jgi:hypothetical protein